MTLVRGSREIQIRFLGRAHTDGDVVVFLPKERMIATGDMITSALSYTGDAFVEEWPATLEAVMGLDFDAVLPGHGNVFKGKDHIRNLQAYWRDFHQQAMSFRKQGLSPEEAHGPDQTRRSYSRRQEPGRRCAWRRSHLRSRGKSERASSIEPPGVRRQYNM
jgi:glyoxylase-like metal-dependent hydrolase (beta-lactamase superfamily II)